MSFKHEITSENQKFLGITRSGQGKLTGGVTVLPFLEETQIITPSDGNFVTRALWRTAHGLYVANGIPGPHQARYDAKRSEGIDGWKTQLVNRELVTRLDQTGAQLLSMHGLFGYGAERTVLEIDRIVEPSIAAPRTRALVPLPETALDLQTLGNNRGIIGQEIAVVGFLVPEELKDDRRKLRRIETFSQEQPSRENPVRIAFMTTGQFGHQDILRNQILGDEVIRRWIHEGRMNLDIYMWNSKHHAKNIGNYAENLRLETRVTDHYLNDNAPGVQVFYNQDLMVAVRGSISMASEADIAVSAIAERVGWTLELPFVALPPVGTNRKMAGNLKWANENGLITSLPEGVLLSDKIIPFFDKNGILINQHYENAEKAKASFAYGDLTGGAQRAAELAFV